MPINLIIAGIVFVFLLVFLIIKLKTPSQEYGEELKKQNPSIPDEKTPLALPLEKTVENKRTIIIFTLGVTILIGGIAYFIFKNKNEATGDSSSFYFPFWLVALIPIFAKKKKKKLI